jgi:hypothetical protein
VARHLPPRSAQHSQLPPHAIDTCLTAALLTFALHIEARIASAIGEGCSTLHSPMPFSTPPPPSSLSATSAPPHAAATAGFYTIGPCGEEALAAVGLALRSTDAVALHYRHLCPPPPPPHPPPYRAHHASSPPIPTAAPPPSRAVSHPAAPSTRCLPPHAPALHSPHAPAPPLAARPCPPLASRARQLALDRARGYTVSSLDPVGIALPPPHTNHAFAAHSLVFLVRERAPP